MTITKFNLLLPLEFYSNLNMENSTEQLAGRLQKYESAIASVTAVYDNLGTEHGPKRLNEKNIKAPTPGTIYYLGELAEVKKARGNIRDKVARIRTNIEEKTLPRLHAKLINHTRLYEAEKQFSQIEDLYIENRLSDEDLEKAEKAIKTIQANINLLLHTVIEDEKLAEAQKILVTIQSPNS